MDGKNHRKWYYGIVIPFIIAFILLRLWWYIPLLLLAFTVVDPDDDLKGKHMIHRWWFTHSMILPTAIWLAFTVPTQTWDFGLGVCLLLPSAVHLLCDIHTNKSRAGTYNIRIRKGKRLSGSGTVIWLLFNGLGELALIGLFLWQAYLKL